MPGMPGGRQFADPVSCGALASKAFTLAAHSGVRGRCGRGGKPVRAEGVLLDELLRAGPPSGTSQTPVKSGNLASADQSAAVGAGFVKLWAAAADASATETSAVMINRRVDLWAQ